MTIFFLFKSSWHTIKFREFLKNYHPHKIFIFQQKKPNELYIWCHSSTILGGDFFFFVRENKKIKFKRGLKFSIFMTSKSLFFIMLKYFCLAWKMKREIIKVKHQAFFQIVWLGPPILKILEGFDGSLRKFKNIKVTHIWRSLFIPSKIFKSSPLKDLQYLKFKYLWQCFYWVFCRFRKQFCNFFSEMPRLNIFRPFQILH